MQAGTRLEFRFNCHQDLESCFLDPWGVEWSVDETGEYGVAFGVSVASVVPPRRVWEEPHRYVGCDGEDALKDDREPPADPFLHLSESRNLSNMQSVRLISA